MLARTYLSASPRSECLASRHFVDPACSPRGGRTFPRRSGLEAVAHARLGDEVLRPAGLALELAADLREVDAEVVRLRLVLRTPHGLEQLALADEASGVADQGLDQVPLGGGEAVLDAVTVHLLGDEVDRERVRLDRRLLFWSGERATDGGPEARQQLVHAERLRDVVVGPGVECGDLVR